MITFNSTNPTVKHVPSMPFYCPVCGRLRRPHDISLQEAGCGATGKLRACGLCGALLLEGGAVGPGAVS